MKALPSLGSSSTSAASPPPRPATGASALVSSTTPPASEEPSPTDLLLATPPTLLKLFALSAPVIHVGATFVQLVTWTHPSFFGSLLVLLSWWALCLFGYWVALYGLNAAVLVLILHKYLASARKGKGASTSSLRHRQRNVTLSPAAYTQLINSAHVLAEHVQVFRTEVVHPLSQHFSLTPLRPSTPAPAYDTAWFLVTSYPFYLVLTFLVPLRYLFLLAGTVGILWQAPFFTTLRALLWRSAFVRWLCRLFVGVLRGGKGVRREWARTRTGLGIPGLVGARAGALGGGKRGEALVEKVAEEVALEEDARTEEGEDVQVQFTVFENQRWWVGLDWTHALLPGERASWTDPDNNPANPPASFVLPPPSVAYVASPTKADPHSRLKKTTEWRWLDPEWHVLRSAVAAGGTVSPPSPTFSRTLGQIAASAVTGSSHSSSTSLSTSPSLSLLSSHSLSSQKQQQQAPSSPSFVSPTSTDLSYADSPLFAAWSVDDEGWQYGDNHFDKMGPRGGLGKYTRRRAWVRRAGLVERTERVPGATAAPALPEGTATAAGGAGAASVVAVKKDGGAASARDERKSGDRSGASPRRRSASGSRSASSGAGGSSAVKSGSGSSGARRRTSLLAGGGGVPEAGGEGVSAGGG
ncbi:integral peroxisomal membrane peroxin-domain-containing protein [Rhodotorula diobovata]|uniref:Integral peroxisomal membrane peroxin-domain-containing protein n=1 Tax=Rhodotorula diobovata TaxID=5288 RepID=A0A5C5FVV6_9BASI|nr:integral peroxisomal membrane peroxin-domain-containing protein [Rhodotorula diobovata]